MVKMTNNEIYTLANQLVTAFNDSTQVLPVKINFYLQKNKNTLLALAQDIETSRVQIAQTYGELDAEANQYIVPADCLEQASRDLEELFSLEQEVQIYKVNIDSFGDDLSFTTAQMEAIMFMID